MRYLERIGAHIQQLLSLLSAVIFSEVNMVYAYEQYLFDKRSSSIRDSRLSHGQTRHHVPLAHLISFPTDCMIDATCFDVDGTPERVATARRARATWGDGRPKGCAAIQETYTDPSLSNLQQGHRNLGYQHEQCVLVKVNFEMFFG